MDVIEEPVSAHNKIVGDEEYQVSAGDWIQIRHGPEADPVIDIERQCPAGRAWQVRVFVCITETEV